MPIIKPVSTPLSKRKVPSSVVTPFKKDQDKNNGITNGTRLFKDEKVTAHAKAHNKLSESDLSLAKHAANTKQIKVIESLMPQELEEEALDSAILALYKCESKDEMTIRICDRLEAHQGGQWNCIIGDGYHFSLRYQTGHYIVFYLGKEKFCIFKSPPV